MAAAEWLLPWFPKTVGALGFLSVVIVSIAAPFTASDPTDPDVARIFVSGLKGVILGIGFGVAVWLAALGVLFGFYALAAHVAARLR